eukprot:TRINITY_DN4437_c0_g1_i1.p1 TRINITY_DN4437_c0_g1~~TRINITY_DN4437_c0_g1_i1.p1  ORF type:complete len:470 (-),score=80.00 TRINITY_DN4437_c0_g1_i1:1449-2858(-)
MNISENQVLRISTEIEKPAMEYNKVHKSWGKITLAASDENLDDQVLPTDFLFLIDVSATMGNDSKLNSVITAFGNALENLTDSHNFSVIIFNQDIHVLTPLIPSNLDNKNRICKQLREQIYPTGVTNVENALIYAIEILKRRNTDKLSSMLIFTDGLSDHSDRKFETIDSPVNCSVDIFGVGVEQDSSLLSMLSMKMHGFYHYVEEIRCLYSNLEECIAGRLSTKMHNIKLKIRGRDGARIVTLATPHTIIQNRIAKSYDIMMGSLYKGEEKTVLFKLSLRKMRNAMNMHGLLDIYVEYTNTSTGMVEEMMCDITVVRPLMPLIQQKSKSLDQHINRYTAATALSEVVTLSNQFHFNEAKDKLYQTIESIKKSESSESPYCKSIVLDLEEIVNNIHDFSTYQTGIHLAHSYSSMYYMEKTSFSHYLKRIQVHQLEKSGYEHHENSDMELEDHLHYTSYYTQLSSCTKCK